MPKPAVNCPATSRHPGRHHRHGFHANQAAKPSAKSNKPPPAVSIEVIKPRLFVQRLALTGTDGQPQLFIVAADGSAQAVPVMLGAEQDGRLLLAAGPEAGVRLIVNGVEKVKDGRGAVRRLYTNAIGNEGQVDIELVTAEERDISTTDYSPPVAGLVQARMAARHRSGARR